MLAAISGSGASSQQPNVSAASGLHVFSVDPITFAVQEETRKLSVSHESRLSTVQPETRKRSVPAEFRLFPVSSETRTIKVA